MKSVMQTMEAQKRISSRLSTSSRIWRGVISAVVPLVIVAACAQADRPPPRTPNIPAALKPLERMKGMNEAFQAVSRVPLGDDVLQPRALNSDPLPKATVGPYELRGETLASALQLVLDDFDISLAFESDFGLTRTITVSNLKGDLAQVINKMCGLADLYCSYDNGIVTVKDRETFVVDLPPIGTEEAYTQISDGLAAVLGQGSGSGSSGGTSGTGGGSTSSSSSTTDGPRVDTTTRVLVYTATGRTQKHAEQYFTKLRKSTALIIFETHVWEVTLDNENRTGIDWTGLLSVGNFNIDFDFPGGAPQGEGTPLTITPSFTGSDTLTSTNVLEFISSQGAVKTISQPQLTVLSGSQATLDVQSVQNYVRSITRTIDEETGDEDITTETDTVNTGMRLTIQSAWDQATVYGSIDITLNELLALEEFPAGDNVIQLPTTTSRSLQTQVRVRPGDSILIAGLVSEKDQAAGSGPGLLRPLIETTRRVATNNAELVFLLRPRIVAYITDEEMAAHLRKEAQKTGDSVPEIIHQMPQSASSDGISPPIIPVKANVTTTAPSPVMAVPTTDGSAIDNAPPVPMAFTPAPAPAQPAQQSPVYPAPVAIAPAPAAAPLPSYGVPATPASPVQRSQAQIEVFPLPGGLTPPAQPAAPAGGNADDLDDIIRRLNGGAADGGTR